jgi:hypothetical protein
MTDPMKADLNRGDNAVFPGAPLAPLPRSNPVVALAAFGIVSLSLMGLMLLGVPIATALFALAIIALIATCLAHGAMAPLLRMVTHGVTGGSFGGSDRGFGPR